MSEWIDTTLGDDRCFKIKGSGINYFDGEKDYLSTSSVEETKITYVEQEITFTKRPSRANMQPVENSIWFAKMKNTLKVLKSDAYLVNRAILSTGFCGIECLSVNDEYFKQFVLSKKFNDQKNLLAEGSTQEAVNNSKIKTIRIGFPKEVTEQSQIATILSTLDRAIASTEQLIAKYQRIKTGLLHDLLTRGIDEHGNLRTEKTHKFKDSKLGRIPVEWECKPLGEYSSIQGGYAFRSKDFVKTGIQLLRIGNLFNNKLSLEREPVYLPNSFNKEFSNFLLKRGDVILSMTGTYGKRDYGFAIKIAEGSFLLNQRVCRFWPKDNLTTNYLFHLLHSEFYLTQLFNSVTGSKQGNLNSKNILYNYVTIPNENEQRKISIVLDKVDKILNTQEVNLSKNQSLKAGLMQDLLSGKVRV